MLGDINVLTGKPCADIFVKGWVDGIKSNAQQTDVHMTSLTGEGNFNWRYEIGNIFIQFWSISLFCLIFIYDGYAHSS